MKKNFSDIFVAFAVIACSLVLLAALTYALAGRSVGPAARILEIDYPDVTGIKLHSEVRCAGAPAGAVTKIRLLTFPERAAADTEEKKRNAVRVTVALLKDVPPLPDDVRASLSAETLLSEKFVALSAGSPTAPKLANGALLQGHGSGGMDALIESIGPLVQSIPPLVESLRPLVQTAEGALKGVGPLLEKTGQTMEDLRAQTLPRFQATADSADAALKRIDKLIADMDEPIKSDLQQLKSSLVQLEQTLGSADRVLSRTDRSLNGRMEELGVVLQNLKVVSTHAKVLTQSLGEKPSRLIFSGKPQKLTPEADIIRSTKPVPGVAR